MIFDRVPSWLYGLTCCCIVATVLLPVPAMLKAISGGVALLCVAAIALTATRFRRRDPYDLELLKEVHERQEIEQEGDVEVPDDADVLCPHCGNLYGAKFKVCPRCMRVP